MKKILFLLLLLFLFPINVEAKEESKIYMIGDSRFVGMSGVDNNDNHVYHAKVSSGYSFMIENLNSIKNNITKNDIVVVNHGVNDLGNKEKYAKFLNNFQEETKCTIYFVTINPINDALATQHGYLVKNNSVIEFNDYMKDNLNKNIKVIDTYSAIIDNFKTSDGIHYHNETYKQILKTIVDTINETKSTINKMQTAKFKTILLSF